jgi:hypothetical protein
MVVFVVDGSQPILVNRLTNDGVLLSLRQNTVEEGKYQYQVEQYLIMDLLVRIGQDL